MSKLVKNEIYKIMHKKSTLITLFIFFLFVLLVTILYAKMDNYNVITYGDESNIKDLENQIANFDEAKSSLNELASLKASLETEKYVLGKNNNWQVEKYYRYIADMVYNYYQVLDVEKNNEKAQSIRQTIDGLLQKIENNDWSYFVNLEIKEIEENIAYTKDLENKTGDYAKDLEIYNYQKYLREYRLNNNVSYENSYLNDALNEQDYLINDKISYEQATKDNIKNNYKESYANFKKNEYILENKIDTKNEQSLRGIIINFFSEYLFLILVFVIMIAGGIVSDEFNKGTIKSLLTLPYTRKQIILAKYITVLLMIPFIILFLLFWQMLLGGIIFGFDSLLIPAIGYNFNIQAVEVMNLAKYFILTFLGKLPLIILLATLAFSLSNLLLSTAFAITLSLCGFFASSIINVFALEYKIKFLNYFVTTNWDLSYSLFGGTSLYSIPLNRSLIICFIYLIIMIIISFKVFQKRNVKNI